jgi:alginate O-acetyltransferase complex protein AlgI
MVFSSVSFLYVFLPAVLVLYFVAPKGFKNAVLLLSSLVFYFFGEPVWILLLALSALSGYLHSLAIEKRRGTKKAKAILVLSVVINLAMLGFFKYADFFIGSLNSLTGAEIPLVNVPLPIGISFFTLQTMSYTIDVYRGRVRAEKNLATVAAFVCLFPKLIAGPIVRYAEVSEALREREINLEELYSGVVRFVIGLGKKVLIANVLGELCAAFRASGDKSVAFHWIYAVAFTLQIYYDFSAYSDMAIGLGRIFGFKLPENFRYPFVSKSITEFWRRWHITLGRWFRDYLYRPLGGNRTSGLKWYLSAALVWLAIGLWHGAAWNFAVWGLLFGLLMILEKQKLLEWLKKAGHVLPHVYVMLVLVISFVIFGADGIGGMSGDLGGLFGANGLSLWSFEAGYYLKSYALVLLIAAIGSTPLPKALWRRFAATKAGKRLALVAEPAYVLVVMLAATAFIADGPFNPFLYFRF